MKNATKNAFKILHAFIGLLWLLISFFVNLSKLSLTIGWSDEMLMLFPSKNQSHPIIGFCSVGLTKNVQNRYVYCPHSLKVSITYMYFENGHAILHFYYKVKVSYSFRYTKKKNSQNVLPFCQTSDRNYGIRFIVVA